MAMVGASGDSNSGMMSAYLSTLPEPCPDRPRRHSDAGTDFSVFITEHSVKIRAFTWQVRSSNIDPHHVLSEGLASFDNRTRQLARGILGAVVMQ
ncbi:hypothetical protein ACEWPM_013290 [Roseovarius sp. S4756]|uniref:hypothetical protein n=1 Tax=Roseovarius maritimus TaxID=3342637 RepID=UPI003727C9A0